MSASLDTNLDGILCEVLGLPRGTVLADNALIEDLPNLDSLKFLKLVNILEEVTGGSVSPDTMMDMETVGDLRKAFGADAR